LSPHWMTIPTPAPSTAFVEKKATFFVSRGLSCVHSGPRVCGSDSPVSEELSTCKELFMNEYGVPELIF